MLLLVGLGNPGADYSRNRHNIGFMTIEALVRHYGFGPDRARFQAIANEGSIGGEKILALRPQTYMNESGRAVGEAMRFFKLVPDNVFVFHDEIDLAFGKVRVKTGGGAAGNNGIRSITAHIGADFHRIRMGVGRGGDAARNHVLSDFAASERASVETMIDAAVRGAELLLKKDFAGYMNKIALVMAPPRKADDGKPDTPPAPGTSSGDE